MICQVKDEDGILLHDKCFVFGNKIDMAGNVQIANDNIEVLKSEAEKRYDIAKDDRIISGSAKAYLESLGKLSADEKARGVLGVSNKLKEWNMVDGIDKLREAMNSYYVNERYKVLQQRVRNSLNDTKKLFNSILGIASCELRKNITNTASLALLAKNRIDNFKGVLHQLIDAKINYLNNDKPFTASIINNVDEIYPDIEEDNDSIAETKKNVARDIDTIFHSKYIDSNVRQSLYRTYLKKIISFSQKEINEFNSKLNEELVSSFIDCLGIRNSNNEIVNSVKALFSKFSINDNRIEYGILIERFNTNVIESIIALPFGSPERLEKITERNIEEFISLSAYFKKNRNGNCNEYKFENGDLFNLICLIITHKYFIDFCDAENTNYINDLCLNISNNNFGVPEVLQNLASSDNQLRNKKGFPDKYFSILKTISKKQYLQKYCSTFSKNGILLPVLSDFFVEYLTNSIVSSIDDVLEHEEEFVEKLVISFSEKYSNMSSFSKVVNYFSNFATLEAVKFSENGFAAFLQKLNDDINILRIVTKYSLCDLIGLERSVISRINNNIELICQNIEKYDANNIFDAWINDNLDKIFPSEIKHLELEQENYLLRKSIINEIQKFMNDSIL